MLDYKKPMKCEQKTDHVFGKAFLTRYLDRTKREIRRRSWTKKRGA